MDVVERIASQIRLASVTDLIDNRNAEVAISHFSSMVCSEFSPSAIGITTSEVSHVVYLIGKSLGLATIVPLKIATTL